MKTRLQYFGENYNDAGVDHFPPGYTIGWVLIPNLQSLKENSGITDINSKINSAYTARAIYSNNECNTNSNFGCISLTDSKSGTVVIGFEDQSFMTGCGDKRSEERRVGKEGGSTLGVCGRA